MTPKEQAEELVLKYYNLKRRALFTFWKDVRYAKKCALIAVNYIIASNPHSNPFNTDVHSTMGYWQEVKQEIEKL
jgi:hypothetical protein